MLALIRRVPSWSLAVLASFIAWANFVALPAAAVVPATLQVEGALLSAQGTPAPDGVYTLDLTLYDAPEGAAPLWQEAGAKVDVKGGAFQHVLGLATPLKAAVLVKASSVWFGVRVGQDPELPRKGLRSVAFALAAVLVAMVSSACAPLQPWERGLLVSQPMQDPGDVGADGFDTHVATIHETASGAGGTGGVSCGCN